jgi:putative aldouronate transport system permease protein
MRYHETTGQKIADGINMAFMVLLCFVMAVPMIHLIAVSVSDPGPVLKMEVGLWPKGLNLEAYRQLITSNNILRTYANTVFVTVMGTILSMVFSLLMAYPLSKSYISVRKPLLQFVVLTMMIQTQIIPLYILVRRMGLYDSLWALIIPYLINPFNLIVLVTFLRGIPQDFEESAKLDGANDLTILMRIYIPLSTAAIASVSLFYAVWYWNVFFPGIMFLSDMDKYPLQVMLRQIIIGEMSIGGSTDVVLDLPPDTRKAAAVFLATVPILTVYPYLQRYFVKGVMLGSIKG